MKKFLKSAVVLSITACSVAGTTYPAGQLFCAVAQNGGGTLIAAVQSAVGVPIIVTGLESAVVAGVCAKWNAAAVPVAPPASVTPLNTPAIAVPAVTVVPTPASS